MMPVWGPLMPRLEGTVAPVTGHPFYATVTIAHP
jgi:hypothetical protein